MCEFHRHEPGSDRNCATPSCLPKSRPQSLVVVAHSALILVNADGTDPRQLTEFGELLGHEAASAAWSPDGEQLISATASGDLIEVRADGSGADTIDLDVGTDDYFAFAPSYSSDSEQIVFSLEVAAAADIYTADRNGSNVVRITDTEVPERFPSWATTTTTE